MALPREKASESLGPQTYDELGIYSVEIAWASGRIREQHRGANGGQHEATLYNTTDEAGQGKGGGEEAKVGISASVNSGVGALGQVTSDAQEQGK